ncbi:hypothetical protein MXB_1904 [Myxobolus squamalis]|nr:hypothetical protein MXB_1904 [Myxobolus squamalis]
MTTEASQVRCNYEKECESLINSQIGEELKAHFNYMSLAFHFDRDDVALNGFYKFFLEMSDEELGHARKLMEFQNKRGGRIVFSAIPAPTQYKTPESLTPLGSIELGLQMEKNIFASLHKIHQKANSHGDMVLTNMLEDMLKEQVSSIKEFGDHITNLKRVGTGLGEYQFNQQLKK